LSTVHGPIPSWRFGRSLEIDAITQFQRSFKGDLVLGVLLVSSEHGIVANTEGPSLSTVGRGDTGGEPRRGTAGRSVMAPRATFRSPPSQATIVEIAHELTGVLGEAKLWVYRAHDQRGMQVSWQTHTSHERDALSLLTRRPCRDVDVFTALGIELCAVQNLLHRMYARKMVVTQMVRKEKFSRATP
jgi:hypothetical protein